MAYGIRYKGIQKIFKIKKADAKGNNIYEKTHK